MTGTGTGTYGITGLPVPENVKRTMNTIPWATNMPVRCEITDFLKSASANADIKKQWTLFVLALEAFKNKPVEEKLSYFQVAGIHSYPGQRWDGAPEPPISSNPQRGGLDGVRSYCAHSTMNFGTWHRPYMLLFERCIWDNMRDLIASWNLDEVENKVWINAANQWRLPYWDWARRQSYTGNFAYPEVFTQKTVQIVPPTTVAGRYPSADAYPNPLWSFENPEKDEHGNSRRFGDMPKEKEQWAISNAPKHPKPDLPIDQSFPWSQCTSTSRYGLFINEKGDGYTGFDGDHNNWNNANATISGNRWLDLPGQKGGFHDPDFREPTDPDFNPIAGNLADCVNRMFTDRYNKTWRDFSTTKFGSDTSPSGYLSLENIHNNLHGITGGYDYKTGVGHMCNVPVAAFDPIFWLHHAQVDRLLAIWQCLYPDRWFDPNESERDEEDRQSFQLQPFHTKNDGSVEEDVWTAEKCRDWNCLNYQYDDIMEMGKDLVDKDGNLNEPQFKQKLRDHVNAIYPSTATVINQIRKEEDTPDGLLIPIDPEANSRKQTWNDYIINVVYDRFAYGGESYLIEFYVGGTENKEETNFDNKKNYVGSVYNFAGASIEEGGCENCKQQAENNVLSCGQVPLTVQLLEHAKDQVSADHPLENFDQVEKYLELHLQWRYVAVGGSVLDPNDFPKTVVKVFKGVGELQGSRAAPVVSRPEDRKVEPALAPGQVAALEVETTFQMSAEQANVPVPVAVPAIYYDYVELEKATEGKIGVDTSN